MGGVPARSHPADPIHAQPKPSPSPPFHGRGGRVLNFALGTLAGGAIVAVALAVGLRQPAVLERLDLAPRPAAGATIVRRSEPPCAPAAATAPQGGQVDPLFAPRRFWFVTP